MIKRQRSVARLQADMWAEACELLEQAERIRRSFFVPGDTPTGIGGWEPPVDIYETAHEIRVVVALPGVARSDLEIKLSRDMLLVAGRRLLPPSLRHATVHRLELPYGRFERRIQLVDIARLVLGKATLADGCLELILEKRT
jgi:HSP20 family molecular chaperone IbpA